MKPEYEKRMRYHPLDEQVLEAHKLHLAKYKGNFRGYSDGIVAYRVFEDERIVVFSGMSDAGTSTINTSDTVLSSLMEECPVIDPKTFRFFDVQTIRGYDYMPRGKFDITEIKFLENGEEHLVPRIKPSQLPGAFLPILQILSHP
jgi:hypothetical protein